MKFQLHGLPCAVCGIPADTYEPGIGTHHHGSVCLDKAPGAAPVSATVFVEVD